MTETKPCPFCLRLLRFEYQTTYNSRVMRFEPLNPVVPGHMLFVPKAHVVDAAESPTVTSRVMMEAAQYAQFEARPFNLITSAGREATQSVMHLHVHYVPRAKDDDLPLPWATQQWERYDEQWGPAPDEYKSRIILKGPWHDILA